MFGMCCLVPIASFSGVGLVLGKQAGPLVASILAGCTMPAAVIPAPGGYFHTSWKVFIALALQGGQQQHDPAERDGAHLSVEF